MEDVIEYNISLIGHREAKNNFKKKLPVKFSEKNISLIGMDKQSFNLELDIEERGKIVSKLFNISIVDSAGENNFISNIKSYFKGCDCIMLIYDITNRESFSFISNIIDNIQDSLQNNYKYIIILLGSNLNKIGSSGYVREVAEEEAKSLCTERKIIYGGEFDLNLISDIEIKEFFKKCVRNIYDKLGNKHCLKQTSKKLKKLTKENKKKCIIF